MVVWKCNICNKDFDCNQYYLKEMTENHLLKHINNFIEITYKEI